MISDSQVNVANPKEFFYQYVAILFVKWKQIEDVYKKSTGFSSSTQ
jgi:hypothetical protein